MSNTRIVIHEFQKKNKFIQADDETAILKSCQNLSLTATAFCFSNHVNKFYNYTLTDDSINLTFKQLKKRGGDCRDYTLLYNRWASFLGLYSKVVTMDIDNETAHMVEIISNKEGYCVLDLDIYHCETFKN